MVEQATLNSARRFAGFNFIIYTIGFGMPGMPGTLVGLAVFSSSFQT